MFSLSLLTYIQVAWKALLRTFSGDFGTLSFFRDRLGRRAVKQDPKKDVNACVDFLETVVKGHWLACACNVLGVGSLDDHLTIPQLKFASEKKAFVESIAQKVVDKLSVVDSAFLNSGTEDCNDKVYNYARVLCHYGSLVMLVGGKVMETGWGVFGNLRFLTSKHPIGQSIHWRLSDFNFK